MNVREAVGRPLAIWLTVALCALAHHAVAAEPTRFTVTVTGQGPDVILIPGLATSGDVWDATVRQLTPTHRVHVIHIRGFGGVDSGINGGEGDLLPPLISEVAQYAAGLPRPAMIGHSIGGLIALEVAEQRPDAVSRLLIVDALPFYSLTISPAASVEMMRPMAATLRTQVLEQGDTQWVANAPLTASRLVKTEDGLQLVAKWTAASDWIVVGKMMAENMLTDARHDLPTITARTTVLYAFDESMGVSLATVAGLFRTAYIGLPGVTLKRVDDSYHFIMLDQPDVFAREVDAFLK
jgi:pimeloyl-ACP methyl ester carboxylesterase